MRKIDTGRGLLESEVDKKMAHCVFYLSMLVQCHQPGAGHDDAVWQKDCYVHASWDRHPTTPAVDSEFRYIEFGGSRHDLTLITTTCDVLEAHPGLIVAFWQRYGPTLMQLRGQGDVMYNMLHRCYSKQINTLERALGTPRG